MPLLLTILSTPERLCDPLKRAPRPTQTPGIRLLYLTFCFRSVGSFNGNVLEGFVTSDFAANCAQGHSCLSKQNIQKRAVKKTVMIISTVNYEVINYLRSQRHASVHSGEFSLNIVYLVDMSKVNTSITNRSSFSDKKFHSIAIVVSGQLAGGARGLTRYV